MNHLRCVLLTIVVMIALATSISAVPTAVAASATATPTPQPTQDRIFYISSQYDTFGDFFVMNGDGTGVRRLSNHLFYDVEKELIKSSHIPYDSDYMTQEYLPGGLRTSPDGRYVAVSWNISFEDSRLPDDNI